jgi:hypothetical protein
MRNLHGVGDGPNRVLREPRSPRDEIAAPARLNAGTLDADGWRLVAQVRGCDQGGSMAPPQRAFAYVIHSRVIVAAAAAWQNQDREPK